MNIHNAISKAARKAKRTNQFVFVVFEGGEYDAASEADLDTHYLGARVVGEVDPDGAYQSARL